MYELSPQKTAGNIVIRKVSMHQEKEDEIDEFYSKLQEPSRKKAWAPIWKVAELIIWPSYVVPLPNAHEPLDYIP